MNKLLSICIGIGFVILSISVGAYLLYYVPKRDNARLGAEKSELQERINRENGNKSNLQECLSAAKETSNNRWDKNCEGRKKEHDCGLPLSLLKELEQIYRSDTQKCFDLYPVK